MKLTELRRVEILGKPEFLLAVKIPFVIRQKHGVLIDRRAAHVELEVLVHPCDEMLSLYLGGFGDYPQA